MRLSTRRVGGCQASLARSPVPLYSEEAGLALLWNAKAGCTFAVKWLYYQEGILEEALAYDPWPHRYRQDVYYQRPGYTEGLGQLLELGDRVVKFVRNPYDRTVSTYLFLCEAWSRPELKHLEILDGLRGHLGREVGHGQLFTFREFVSYLGSIDLDVADIHLIRQTHACERDGKLADMTIVRIEESAARLPEIEERLGLRPSDHGRLRRSRHHTVRQDLTRFAGDTPFEATVGVSVPPTIAFYDAELVRQVSELYGSDADRYGYGTPS